MKLRAARKYRYLWLFLLVMMILTTGMMVLYKSWWLAIMFAVVSIQFGFYCYRIWNYRLELQPGLLIEVYSSRTRHIEFVKLLQLSLLNKGKQSFVCIVVREINGGDTTLTLMSCTPVQAVYAWVVKTYPEAKIDGRIVGKVTAPLASFWLSG